MKYISAILLVCLVFGASGCKQQENPVTEPTIFEDYFVRFLSQEQQLKSQAVFATGDSANAITPYIPLGGVSFLGSGMEMRKISEDLIRYTLEIQAAYQIPFKFRFKNTQGTFNTYEISMTPIEDFFIKNMVSKTKGTDLVINGGLLSKEETLVFIFSDADNVAASHTVKGPIKDITYNIPPAIFKNLVPGTGKLYLVKKILKNESLDNREIHAEIEFYSKDIDIEIKE
jgi:hypothetical protein